jgi:preprotein translocase subunit YajC
VSGPTGAILTVGEAATVTVAAEDKVEVALKLSVTVTVIEEDTEEAGE